MGSIISAIADDIADYKALCEQFGEKVRYRMTSGGEQPDCYGAHAESLKERAKARSAKGPAKESKMPDKKKDLGPLERAALDRVEEARHQDQENQWAAREIQKYTPTQQQALMRALHEHFHGDGVDD